MHDPSDLKCESLHCANLRRSTVRMATVLAIPDLLRSLGANPEEVLRELGYDLKLFDRRARLGSPTQFATTS